MLHQRQLRGIIALAISLAVIPFFGFVQHHYRLQDFHAPVFSVAGDRSVVVEFNDDSEHSGIYFLEPSATFKIIHQSIFPNSVINGNDFKLENGMSLKRIDHDGKSEIFLDKISAVKRIALGLPIDINLATFDELLLVPGLGESTVEKILSRRQEAGRFDNMKQLDEINGIKEKRRRKLSQHLYVEKDEKDRKKQKNEVRMIY